MTNQDARSADKIKVEICEVAKRLYGRNLLAAADGNISFRVNDNQIWITPSGLAKAFMRPDQMALMNLAGEVLEGKASSEMQMHLAVYRSRPEARAVVHAHPPTAVAWSVARPELKELPCNALSELILALGTIPIVPYARPGTAAMGENVAAFTAQSRAMILARHGALCWGESLAEACGAMERVEHVAQILKCAHELGGLSFLPASEIAELQAMRKKMGNRSL